MLEGHQGPAACLALPPAGSYRASFRFRATAPPAALGLSFTVEGASSLWSLEGERLADGAWHTAHVLVSGPWVVLMVDGLPCHRVLREGFRPNPAPPLEGVGLAAWGGRMELSSFVLEALP